MVTLSIKITKIKNIQNPGTGHWPRLVSVSSIQRRPAQPAWHSFNVHPPSFLPRPYLLAWIAHRFASSNKWTRWASAASCKAKREFACHRYCFVLISPCTSRTKRAKGSRRKRSSVVRWYCLISRKARIPGRARRFLGSSSDKEGKGGEGKERNGVEMYPSGEFQRSQTLEDRLSRAHLFPPAVLLPSYMLLTSFVLPSLSSCTSPCW